MKHNLIRLSKADDLPIKKSTLYKWSAKGRFYPELFIKLGGLVYVDLDKLEKVIEENRKEIAKDEPL